MLIQRVITAVILLIILAGSVWLSPLAFAAVMTVSVSAAVWEWLRMLRLRAALPAAVLIGVLLYGLWFAGIRIPEHVFLMLAGIDAAVWILLTAALFIHRHDGFRLPETVQMLMALLMLPLAWYALMVLFEAGGWQMVVSVLVIVWTADIFAYFCGRIFGRHRMAPAISPKKTWEGAAGAFVFGAAVLLLLSMSGRPDVFQSVITELIGVPAAIAVTFVLTVLSMAGDLMESAAKRQAGIKDSSNLLPGHGGFFDRLDACIPVLPAAALVLLAVSGF